MAKDAIQFDEQHNDDAPTSAESQVAATPNDASPNDANDNARRGRKPKQAIEPSDLQGLKYFDKLKPLLARLHEVGTERDSAENRELHMDQYCLLVLLWMFSPLLTSMRALQQASELDKVQKKLGVGRTSLGSFSESVRIFDPEPLKEIAAEPAGQLPQPSQGPFDSIGKTLTAVDGSVVDTIVKVSRLAWLPKGGGKMTYGYRLHTQFEIFRGTVGHGSADDSCGTDRRGIPFEMADRIIFQDVQTVAGLPPSAEHKTKWRRNSDVSGDHRVPADSDLHRACSDKADV